MRAREVLSSVGAGGSLIAAGLVSLLLFSSLLAFRAWPDGAAARPDGSLALRTPSAKADGRAASGPQLAADLAPAPAARREAGDRGRVRERPRRRRPTPARGGAGAPATTAPSTPVSSAPASGPAAPAVPAQHARRESSGGDGTGGGGSGGDTSEPGAVQTLTDAGRTVVEQVTEPLPPAVNEPVAPVLDTVDAIAATVDDTVTPLLPALP